MKRIPQRVALDMYRVGVAALPALQELKAAQAELKAERRRSAALLRDLKRIGRETRESWTARLVNDALAADDDGLQDRRRDG